MEDCDACKQAELIIKRVEPFFKDMIGSECVEGEQTFDDIMASMCMMEATHLKEWHCKCETQAVSIEELLHSVGIKTKRLEAE